MAIPRVRDSPERRAPSTMGDKYMIESLGLAIQRAARFILRITLGLRVPAARVRMHDQKSRHDYALDQL